MQSIKSILAATDLSEPSDHAVRAAAALAELTARRRCRLDRPGAASSAADGRCVPRQHGRSCDQKCRCAMSDRARSDEAATAAHSRSHRSLRTSDGCAGDCVELGDCTRGIGTATAGDILHVIPQVFNFADVPLDAGNIQTQLAESVTAVSKRAGADTGVTIQQELRWADSPADEILKFAEESQADLIVMGTHGYGAFKRALIGSVAGAVARAANRPVLLVPPALWKGEAD